MALIVDIGSGNTRVGYGGDELPTEVFPTVVEPTNDTDEELRPVVRGVVSNWDGIETLWEQIFTKMGVQGQKQPVITTDSPTVLERDRNKMAELLFEKFEVPAYFVGSQSVFSLYAEGRTWGIVVDSGYGVTHAMAIHEGFAFPHTIGQLDLGGADICRNMVELFDDRGISLGDYGGIDTVTNIFHEHGHAPMDFASEALQLRLKPDTAPTYVLPDGQSIQLESEHIRAPEALFQPALAGCRGSGIADMVWDIVQTCDSDREGGPMRKLSQFVLMVGGCSRISNIQERLKQELDAKSTLPRETFVTALATPERHHSAWVGASILANLPQFIENNFVSRAEFLESGSAAITKRCV